MASDSNLKSQKDLPAEIPQSSIKLEGNKLKYIPIDRFENLVEENNRNKKRLKHMEGIGAIVGATTEQNFQLQRDNDQLREKMDALVTEVDLLRQKLEKKSTESPLENGRTISPASSSGYEMVDSSCTSDEGEVTQQKLPRHNQNNEARRQTPSPTSYFPNRSRRFVKADSMDGGTSSVTSLDPELREMQSFVEMLRSNTAIEQFPDDLRTSQHHTKQKQNPLTRHSPTEEQLSNGNSLSFQFEKCLELVTRVIERELKYKKKVKTTQAFCDALMLENDTLKRDNKEMSEKLLNKDSELKRLNYELKTSNMEVDEMRAQRTTNPLEFYQRVDDGMTNLPSDDVAYLTKLQSRIKKLERQRAEVLGVNKQWDAKYKKDIESMNEHMLKLKEENKTLKSLTDNSPGRKRNVDMLLLESRKQIDNLKSEKNSLAQNFAMEHRKCKELKESNTKMGKEIHNISAENKRLSQALEVAYGTASIGEEHTKVTVSLYDSVAPPMNPPTTSCAAPIVSVVAGEPNHSKEKGASGNSDEYKTNMDLLSQQVKIYQEDFETERRDREKSQSEKQELEERLKGMAQEIQALTEQVKINEQDFRQERRDKKKLQRQMERFHVQTGAPATAMTSRHHNDVYYSRDDYPHHQSSDDVHQFPTSDNYHTSRRYPRTSSRPLPPPYTHDTSRTIPPRRIRNGYLERSNDISYPPNSADNIRY